jgi:hypothetical protein
MTRALPGRQRGVALIALLAVIALGTTWFLLKQLNADSGALAASRTARNAQVLSRAKQALIGYVAAQAAKTGENNPGAMPCPENPGDFDSTTGRQGLVGTGCGTTTVGRFPWRTLGLDRLVDAAGEPLWYVVSPGWGVASTSVNTSINSNTVGQLTVDGVPNAAVALIIAPGPAFNVAASGSCAAKSQARPTTGNPDWSNYLECDNATYPTPDASFVTTGPSASFNDQVVMITVDDILPAVEAAITDRIQREIAPLLKSMYSGGAWSGSSSAPRFPYPAAFTNLSVNPMQGSATLLQGLLPLAYAETTPGSGTLCTPVATAPRCNPTFVSWTGAALSGASLYSPSCTVTATQLNCTYYYTCALLGCSATDLYFTLTATAANVAMAMRTLNPATTMTNVGTSGRAASASLNADGSATITLTGTTTAPASGVFASVLNTFCGLLPLDATLGCLQSSLSIPITLLADHVLLDATSTGTNPGWFLRNKWHEVAYYALAAGFSASAATPSCVSGATCLSVSYHRDVNYADDAGKQRAVLLLSGRSLTGSTRPNTNLADWFEGANTNGTSPFQVRSPPLNINRDFNDHVAVIDSN